MRYTTRSQQSRLLGAVAFAALSGCGLSGTILGEQRREYVLAPVAGLDVLVPVPDENPLTRDAIALGERLFFDPGLSADGTIRCASCHRPEYAFSDTARISRGVYGRHGERNAPTLINRAWGRAFFWDGRTTTLESQVLHPIRDSVEMGQPIPALIERLRADRTYRSAFARSYGAGSVDSQAVARALASYVRTLRSGAASIDRWRDGDTTALSPSARRGLALFTGRGNCVTCHVGPNFTDEEFHNTGISARSARYALRMDSGRARITARPDDVGSFKTPTLRDVARSAPYMHDGSLTTLEDVIAFYDGGGVVNPNLDVEIRPLALTHAERHDILAFLMALTGTSDLSGAERRGGRAGARSVPPQSP